MNIDHDHSFYCQSLNQMDTNTEGNGPSQDPPQVLSPQVSEVPSPPAGEKDPLLPPLQNASPIKPNPEPHKPVASNGITVLPRCTSQSPPHNSVDNEHINHTTAGFISERRRTFKGCSSFVDICIPEMGLMRSHVFVPWHEGTAVN
ncbi:hypothetical protein CDAR_442281 [Caerostris darwini]|uniref:Uncharacterized protein n=1 Tax=Caerostris darwini TaxID=1538125 RepID=A0AAV4V0M4_9ARAC|nr:hypothetical protein CDAR_442281 [Caerostris darwini]